jgi:MSHA biogenesis protein MshP
MKLSRHRHSERQSRVAYQYARGFSIVSAIFLVVVLAGLGAAIVRITASQSTGSALDVQGARAYQAARAGIEWGLYKQLRDDTCTATPVSFQLPGGTLQSFTVTVRCLETAYDSTTGSSGIAVDPKINSYQVTATACNIPAAGNCPGTSNSPDYVQRQLQVTFTQ